jgi:hypothetical protein
MYRIIVDTRSWVAIVAVIVPLLPPKQLTGGAK